MQCAEELSAHLRALPYQATPGLSMRLDYGEGLAVFSVPMWDPLNELAILLECLTSLNQLYFARVSAPRLYDASVRYEGEEVGKEDWLTAPYILRRRKDDCEGLACYLAAERRRYGERARAIAYEAGRGRRGGRNYHIVTELSDGSIEDPSRKLGMGREA